MINAMSKRAYISPKIECEVLMACRRRCCLCVFLKDNRAERPGQIAHIDQDPANNDLENLAYLCLEHHDQYDSQTSQSKGMQEGELRRYVEKLHALVESGKLSDAQRGDFRVEHFEIETERCGWQRGKYAPESIHEPNIECPAYRMGKGAPSHPVFLVGVFNGTGRPQIINRITIARLELSQYCGGPAAQLVVPLKTYEIPMPAFRGVSTESLSPPIHVPDNQIASFSISIILPKHHFGVQYYELLFAIHAASGLSADAGPVKIGGMRVHEPS